MKKNATFTICAKNYLAQAFSLKKSFIEKNPNDDFFIFLADTIDESIRRYDEIIQLSTDFIPKWEEMAFKYNVIEFNTSIKPFCINKLFNEGYEKVIYLDPDIYVTDSLKHIYDILDVKDFVLTPHFNHLKYDYDGAVPENGILKVGIFNLGFFAVKNSSIGHDIVSWWMKKLTDWCYADGNLGVFVDQKWMALLPGFYINEMCVLQDPGANAAIWNLHERELSIEDGKFFITDTITNEKSPLLFFHFSGFDPYTEDYINRRHPQYNVNIFPSFKPIIDEYRKIEYENDYDYYSILPYSFSCFTNGIAILPINRGIYKGIEDKYKHPFSNEELIQFFKKKNLLSKRKNLYIGKYQGKDKTKKGQSIIKLFRIALKILKADKFNALLGALQTISSFQHQDYLYKDVSWEDLYN